MILGDPVISITKIFLAWVAMALTMCQWLHHFAVYDVTSRESLQHLETWLNEVDMYATKKGLVKMLVGNKIDKGTQDVPRSDGLQFARRNSMLFIEARLECPKGNHLVWHGD